MTEETSPQTVASSDDFPLRERGRKTHANFIAAHWRGDYSLPISYWLISFGTNIAASVVTTGVTAFIESRREFDPVVVWVGLVTMFLALVSITVWHFVGTWRSASRYREDPKNAQKSWGGVVMLMLILGSGHAAVSHLNTLSIVAHFTPIAFAGDPGIPDYGLAVTEGGKELKIDGGFKYGLIAEVEKHLTENPGITTIDLESVGGRIGVGVDLFNLIERRGLDTVTNGICVSACTIAFAAGRTRSLGPNGRLGFHGGALEGVSKADIKRGTSDINRRIVAKNGTSLVFLEKTEAIPSDDMWYPDRAILLREKIITGKTAVAASSVALIQKDLLAVRQKLLPTLPQKFDSYTTLADVSVRGRLFVFIYEVSADIAYLVKEPPRLEAIRKSVLESVCQNQSYKDDLELGVIYGYHYRNATSHERVGYFEVTSC